MHYCREEVVLYLAEYIAILAKTVEGYGLEIKRARRKFIYWGDLNPILYSINEELLFTKTDRILKDEVVRNRELYMHLIAYACYKSILDGDKNIQSQIEDDALCKHKIDYDYVDALKYFSSSYSVRRQIVGGGKC